MSTPVEVALLLRWCDLAIYGLGDAREEIDSLNVYPVQDSDTGTNLFLTFEAARTALVEAEPTSLAAALTVFGRGALLAARGSSGVILSQLLRAGADQLLRGDATRPARLLADTLRSAAEAAYTAVATPVEGTMLTVARAAADAADAAVDQSTVAAPEEPLVQMAQVVTAAAVAARLALAQTTGQLEVLSRAGVVDAGGLGLCVLFDAAVQAMTGRRADSDVDRLRSQRSPLPVPAGARQHLRGYPDGPGYEVMFLLDADDARIMTLRERLGSLGDSLVVVGGDGLWNVHVHVDDVGAALEAGVQAGRPHRVRVTHFDRAGAVAPEDSTGSGGNVGRGMVALTAGPGVGDLFEAAGAVVVPIGPGRRCSSQQLLDAIGSTRACEVIVLPNRAGAQQVAEAAARAARDIGIRAAVIPTRAQVQGLAAIAVHDAGRSFEADVVQMTAAAGHTRHGAVTIASTDALTMAGPCSVGDCLGVVEGDFALVGSDMASVATGVVERLVAGGGELVTLVTGSGIDESLVRRVAAAVEQLHAGVDVVTCAGGQERYPLLIGVE